MASTRKKIFLDVPEKSRKTRLLRFKNERLKGILKVNSGKSGTSYDGNDESTDEVFACSSSAQQSSESESDTETLSKSCKMANNSASETKGGCVPAPERPRRVRRMTSSAVYEALHPVYPKLASYWMSVRPWSFMASLAPIALGAVLAYKETSVFDLWVFLATLFTILSVHGAGNLVNTFFDYHRGIDSKKSDDRTLVDSILSSEAVINLGALFYFLGCVGFVVVDWLSPATMEHLALIYFGGLSSSFLYTGGIGLKYIALGDILIIITFGPVCVLFAFIAQAGKLSWLPLAYAIPLALNTECILHTNNARDMLVDKEAGIVTIAIMLGQTGSYILFVLLLFVPYVIFAVMAFHSTAWLFLPLVTLPVVFRLEKQYRRQEMKKLPQKLAKLNFALGMLYMLGCLMASPTDLPGLN